MYVTESLRLQGEGKHLAMKYLELLNPPREIDVQAVVEHVLAGLEA